MEIQSSTSQFNLDKQNLSAASIQRHRQGSSARQLVQSLRTTFEIAHLISLNFTSHSFKWDTEQGCSHVK